MNPDFVLEIDPQEWQDAFESLYYYFDKNKDMMQALGIESKRTLVKHRSGESQFIDTETAEKAINILNRSELLFDLDRQIDTVESHGLRRANVDSDFQRYVFEPFSSAELEEKTGKSRGTVKDYKYGEVRPPENLFKECLEEVKSARDMGFRPKGDIYRYGNFNSDSREEPVMVSDAGYEEILEFNRAKKGLELLERRNPAGYTGLENSPEALDEIMEVARNPIRSDLRSGDLNSSSSNLMHGLRDLGVIERYGGDRSNYEIKASETYLETLRSLI